MIARELLVDADTLFRATGWRVKPEGACKGPVCVPLPDGVRRDDGIDIGGARRPSGHGPRPRRRGVGTRPRVHDQRARADHGGRARTRAARRERAAVPAGGPARTQGRARRLGVLVRLSRGPAAVAGAARGTARRGAHGRHRRPRRGGAAAARPWIEKAAPSHPALVDTGHVLGARFGVVNVPNGVWIDEGGRIVRPAEPAWLEDPHASSELAAQALDELPPDHREVREQISRMTIDTSAYPRMIRDWVRCGSDSEYALPEHEVVARSVPRSRDQSLAAAHFELGEYRHRTGDHDAAVEHWRAAHRLQPDNWTYKRQAWNLEEPESVRTVSRYGTGWLDDVRAMGAANYYPQIIP